MANYVIGDVQGCFTSLQQLVKKIKFDPERDRLWFVGDLVNRGPDSLAVLRYVKGLGSAATTVLGNHDLHLLAIWCGVTTPHRKDTLQEVLSAPDCNELLTWLRYRPLLYQDQGFLMVHAGLLPQWTAKQAAKLAHEVELALQSKNFDGLLPSIYFRSSQNDWQDTLSYEERLGFASNVLTRLRVCSANGVPDYSFKGVSSDIPQGYLPWFQVPGRATKDQSIIFGHWSALGLHINGNVFGVDAGCVWGRELAAIRLEDQKVFCVSCSS